MGQIPGTPQEKFVKLTLVNKLEEELLLNYNNIVNFESTINEFKYHLNTLAQTYEADPDFSTKYDEFVTNINEYIPDLETKEDGSNVFLDNLKSTMINIYDTLPEDSIINSILNINSLEDISNLTEIPPNFVNHITDTIVSSSISNILTDFPLDEFSMGSILSVAEHNLGLQNIAGSIDNIISISDTLINKFPEFANMEAIQSMLNSLPEKLANMSLDVLGNLNITNLLESIGLSSFSDLLNIFNIKDLFNNFIGNIMGSISGLLGGFLGACGCSLLSGGFRGLINTLGSISSLKDLGQALIGQLNSTMRSILNNTSLSNFPGVSQLQDALNSQLDSFRNVIETDQDWLDVIKT